MIERAVAKHTTEQPGHRKRPRFAISVRMLMILVLAFGCWLGWYARSIRIQRDAVAAIKRAGGSVWYDWELGGDPNIINPNKARAPKWLLDRVGVDYFANVVGVNLARNWGKQRANANDETLAHVGRLDSLEDLQLSSSAISDAGLAHIEGLTRLRTLQLEHTGITDSGLAHLKRLRTLRLLDLAGTRVSDEGVLDLELSLPDAQIFRDEVYLAPGGLNPMRAGQDLEFARSRPIRQACLLLAERARQMAARRNDAEIVATVRVVLELQASDKVSLVKIANACAEAINALDKVHASYLPVEERQALQQRCADHAIAALRSAINQGYRNVAYLKGPYLWSLRRYPAFMQTIESLERRGSQGAR
jgi:hypothetical protein